MTHNRANATFRETYKPTEAVLAALGMGNLIVGLWNRLRGLEPGTPEWTALSASITEATLGYTAATLDIAASSTRRAQRA